MLMWKQSMTGARCVLRRALNSQHIQKQTSRSRSETWRTPDKELIACTKWTLGFETRSTNRLDEEIKLYYILRNYDMKHNVKTFYDIMKSILNIFRFMMKLWRDRLHCAGCHSLATDGKHCIYIYIYIYTLTGILLGNLLNCLVNTNC